MNIKDYKGAENSSYNANGGGEQCSLANIWAKLIGKKFKNVKT